MAKCGYGVDDGVKIHEHPHIGDIHVHITVTGSSRANSIVRDPVLLKIKNQTDMSITK